jgi:homocysteine S-methyltransferase
MPGFLDALDTRVLVCDGAMGTMLYTKGVFLNRCFDELNLTRPDLVLDVHREYLRAGADLIETNTFGANRFKLGHFGLADETARINREGAVIARRAAAGRAWVAGSIGPLGQRIEPWGRTSAEDAEAAFRDQARALVEGGVDLFMLETFGDVNEIVAAIRAVRSVSSLPIVAQVTTGEDGHTPDGTPPEVFAAALQRAGADVLGVNCSVGPAAMLETIEAMARVSSARLAAQPNAGRPREVDGRSLYLSSPEYMASYARRFIAAGARLVGGCCGTSPEHTRQMVQAVRGARLGTRPAPVRPVDGQPEARVGVSRREKSALAAALAAGQFAVVVEVAAPRGLDVSDPVLQARRFRDLGAVAVNVPDYPKSGARASALALAALVEQSGTETLLHYVCRDRRLVGMQADLVAAHALGLRNVLLTTGTPAGTGSHPNATSLFDVDAIGLINLVAHLNRGLDLGDQRLDDVARFHAGAAVNPFAADLDAEWRRVTRKVEAGAEFFVTPPIFDVDAFAPVLIRLQDTGLPVLAGLAALEGIRHAEFLASEVIGVRLPEWLVTRLRQASDEAAEAMTVTAEIAAWLAERANGLQITTFHGSPETAEHVLAAIGPSLTGSTAPRGAQHG